MIGTGSGSLHSSGKQESANYFRTLQHNTALLNVCMALLKLNF